MNFSFRPMTLEAILFNECQQLNKIPELFGIELIDMIQNAEVVDVNDLIQNSNVVNDDINVETNNVPFEPTIESVWTIVENEELCTEVVVDVQPKTDPLLASNQPSTLEDFKWESDIPILEDYFVESEE